MSTKRLLLGGALVVGMSATTSCTVAKPLVCAVTTPVYVLAGTHGCGCWGNGGRGAICGLAFISLFGACSGLVTGIISDINFVTGRTHHPARNLHHPFLTNTCSDG